VSIHRSSLVSSLRWQSIQRARKFSGMLLLGLGLKATFLGLGLGILWPWPWPWAFGLDLDLGLNAVALEKKTRPNIAILNILHQQRSSREFQARAAATGNARSPRVRRRVAGTISVDVAADRRRLHCRNCGWLSNAKSRRGTWAMYHEGTGKPEHKAETLSSLEFSTNVVRRVTELCVLTFWRE